MAKIMVQGTGSSVGKSILVAALCRIFKQDGYKVCPYKSQNMSLNSYITLDGKEMGRAQVLQAYAAGLEPEVYMNPILLKPTSDRKCQVIVKGEVYCNSDAVGYHNMKLEFADMLKKDFQELEKAFDIIVMEGAGSPAEINLRDRDIVNMGMAELVDAPVILVGDIDKGGVFASLAGTMLLLQDDEKIRVKGTIINKFRGDIELLNPGIDMLEDIIKIPNLGVVPYFRLDLEDEDGAIEFNKKVTAPIDIAVMKLPHISNFTDLDALKLEPDVSVRFISNANEFGEPDLLIIPGSKNTIEDLLFIRKQGLEPLIKAQPEKAMLIGICGGYQMLGNTIKDTYSVESSVAETEGLRLLNVDTSFEEEKVMERVQGTVHHISGLSVYGYEIHMGVSTYGEDVEPLVDILQDGTGKVHHVEGAINEAGTVMGTYLHGIFDGTGFREHILNKIRVKKGLEKLRSEVYENIREQELDKLADIVRSSVDMKKIYEVMSISKQNEH